MPPSALLGNTSIIDHMEMREGYNEEWYGVAGAWWTESAKTQLGRKLANGLRVYLHFHKHEEECTQFCGDASKIEWEKLGSKI